MDQHVSEQSPTKYRGVLLEMRRDASPGLNMLYLSGLAETLSLIDQMNAEHPGRLKLKASEIARVLHAWGDFEGNTWTGGFVVELLDSRRMYVESGADGIDWGPESWVSVVALPPGRALPILPRNHDSVLFGWFEDLTELNEYLGRLA